MPASKLLWMVPFALALSAAPATGEELPSVSAPPPAGDVLAHMDETRVQRDWLGFQLGHLHLQKRHGFAYTREIGSRERGMEFSVQGPAVGPKKTVGLGFELRF